jgi:hypothetical protein
MPRRCLIAAALLIVPTGAGAQFQGLEIPNGFYRSVAQTIRSAGHECEEVRRAESLPRAQADEYWRDGLYAYEAHCTNGKTFIVALPPATARPNGGPPPKVIAKPQ